MTGVSECSQQRGNLKDDGYKSSIFPCTVILVSIFFISFFDIFILWKSQDFINLEKGVLT
ncbi:hypothetical protein [Photorhabdus sp. RM96S]|uniref:hypothetical protein n=1 Tax=Photorhabdus TaxID=29487 RepID=UPI0036DD66FD